MGSEMVVWVVQSGFMALVAATMLWLQIGAYRRHHHGSFLILALGSMFGILQIAASLASNLAAQNTMQVAILRSGAAVFLLLAIALGLIGTVLLFRSYAELAEIVKIQQKTSL